MRLNNMTKPKKIYCPQCGRKVCTWDGKSTIHPMVMCKRCEKIVVYRIETDEIELKELPPREQGSGIRFW